MIDQGKPNGFRNYCMVPTLVDTGIRLSELAGFDPIRHPMGIAPRPVEGKGQVARPLKHVVQTQLPLDRLSVPPKAAAHARDVARDPNISSHLKAMTNHWTPYSSDPLLIPDTFSQGLWDPFRHKWGVLALTENKDLPAS